MGNGFARRALIEAAWHYRQFSARITPHLQKRQEGLPKAVTDTAWKAQSRLHGRFKQPAGAGQRKKPQVAAAAVARELAGFVWAIGRMASNPSPESMTGFIALELAPAGFAGPATCRPGLPLARLQPALRLRPRMSPILRWSRSQPERPRTARQSQTHTAQNPIATNTPHPFSEPEAGTRSGATSVVVNWR